MDNRNRQGRGGSRPANPNAYGPYPPQKRKKKNEDGFLWFLIVVLTASIIFATGFLIAYGAKDTDGSEKEPGEVEQPTETKGEPKPQETQEADEPIPPQTEPPVTAANPMGFAADLSEYEMYMNPMGAQRDDYLILVNPKNALDSKYVPKDLVDVKSTRKDGQRKTQQLRKYAAMALEAMMLEAEAVGVIRTNTPSGYPLSVMSAYRTYEYQDSLFNNYVSNEMSSRGISREEAEAIVVTYSCRAGTSEHQTGLCVDMHTLTAANIAFRNEPESTWLLNNCHKFGFVLRFPEDKTGITGIQYEPWHFRYVGRYHATKMKDLGMCLEEYTEYLKNNG